jgi:DNA-binding NtrC family response regulator
MARILLIDDDADFAGEVSERLSQLGHQVRYLDNPEEALALACSGDHFDVILLDNKMPRMSGLGFLEAAGRRGCRVPVILMTSAHLDATAINAVNLGAFDYVIKPIDLDEFIADLRPIIERAAEVSRRPAAVPLPENPAAEPEPAEQSVIVGKSKPMIELLIQIGRLARLDDSVLILGETGTGKELVARALHTNSPRKNGPYVALNCSAFNEHLLDDELFGHEPGAFTGAVKLRKGRFEYAKGGTLFLDEAGDMSLNLQAKLLRVLDNHEITRLGSNEAISVDVRVLAATHRDLAAMVREKQFRQDLFHRLTGATIRLPPLRERKGDVERLADAFLARTFADSRAAPALHPQALQKLREHHWPGNVRQLQKVLRRAASVCRGSLILPEDVDFGGDDSPPAADDSVSGLRSLIGSAWDGQPGRVWDYLHDLLDLELLSFAQEQGVSLKKLAERLGKSRNYVRERLKHFGLSAPSEDE